MFVRNRTASIKHPAYCPALLLALAALLYSNPAAAQDWVKPDITQLQRLDLRDLGYLMVNEIPANSSAITSLLTAADGKIYGGTTGDNAYLFVFDPRINKVRHLGRLKSDQSIHHSLVQGKDGLLYLGSGKNPFEEFEYNPGPKKGPQGVEKTVWKDIQEHYRGYAGGHLYRYNPASDSKVKLPNMDCEVADLGIPVAGNSVYALAVSPSGEQIYGLSYPDGHLFSYDIATAAFKDLGAVDSGLSFHGPERHWRSLPRALICDNWGNVYTSGSEGELIYYSPSEGKIIRTGYYLPEDRYPGEDFSYAVAEYFALGQDGRIYGGSSDGYLFSFRPGAGLELANLGKLRSSRRLRALAAGTDGKIYMMAGERAGTRPCQLFTYDTRKGGFESLGLLIVDHSPYYYWRGYQFDSMTTGLDGTIYFGESERKSHLFLYVP